jgi:predicted RNase H-like HicB family nuclease
MNFKVVLQEAEECGYIVSCAAIPGCHSQGDSMEEALENIKEANSRLHAVSGARADEIGRFWIGLLK